PFMGCSRGSLCFPSSPQPHPGLPRLPVPTLFRSGPGRWPATLTDWLRGRLQSVSGGPMAPWSPVFVQVRAGYPTYPTRCQHEGDGKRAGQSTKSLKSPIAPCHCIHVGDSETSPPIHTYISFPTRDIVTSGGYVGFCLLTCTFMGCARGGPCWHQSPKTQPDLHR